ncbi:MAG: 5-(carboxyamino)imidazole ribonucleotide synthase [Phycisphaerales bacterium]
MRIGVLGGGQLGLMLAEAGEPLGFEFRFLDPSEESPAGQRRAQVRAAFEDLSAIDRFADGLDVATFEFENVGPAALERLAARVPLRPGTASLEMKHDRLVEKRFLLDCGIAVPRFASIERATDLSAASEEVGAPAILKTRRFGYDGKGQVLVERVEDLDGAWHSLGDSPCILEQKVDFVREVSALVVRGLDGACRHWPLAENLHRGGILRRTVAPAPGAPDVATANRWAESIADRLGHVGVLALELFECRDGSLLANEFAPRVHNSGHWTIEGARTSQFENHVRAIVGLPLGDTSPLGHASMVNLIGRCPETASMLAVSGARLHLYGKLPRDGRKLGHATVVAASCADAAAAADRLLALAQASSDGR